MTSPATQPEGSVRIASAGLELADRYRLERPLAAGGMAQVWAATDQVLGRKVAVKLLHPHLASDGSFRKRFRLEAVAAARLRHPNIIAVYDTVSEPGLEAIVMELVEGTTLRQLMDQRGQLALADVVDIASQVAEALDAAHRGGVVHRDIKPSNILLVPDGRVVVTDFGIAKAGQDSDLTVTGTLLGTAKYLSPEQVTGDPVDPRADLYSLGVVMFEALCGRPPFLAETDAGTALARLHHDPPSPRAFRPEIPRSLEAVVLRALACDPTRRWSRATELRAALSLVTSPEPDDTESPTVMARRPGLVPTPAEPPDEAPGFVRSERTWLVPALFVVLTAAGLGLSGALFSQTTVGRDLVDRGLGRSPTLTDVATTPTVPLDPSEQGAAPGLIGRAEAFDPFGDGEERNAEAPLAIDGDSGTYWPTQTYNDPDIAGSGLKAGVGLILHLDVERDLTVLEVTTAGTEGWRAEIYVGGGFGADRAGWGPVVASGESLGTRAQFDLGGARGAAVLLWITHTGTTAADGGPPLNRLQVADIRIA